MRPHSEAKTFQLSRGFVECDESGLRVAGQTLVARSVSDEWTVLDQGAAAVALTRTYGFPITLTGKAAGLATVAKALREDNLPKAQVAALLLKFPDPLIGNPSRNERQVLADCLAFSALLDTSQFAPRAVSERSAGPDCNNGLENQMRKNGFDPSQPRDDHGRWTDEGGGSDSSAQDAHVTDAAYQGEYHDSLAQHEIEQWRNMKLSNTGKLERHVSPRPV